MPRLIRIFARRTVILLVLSRGGSFYLKQSMYIMFILNRSRSNCSELKLLLKVPKCWFHKLLCVYTWHKNWTHTPLIQKIKIWAASWQTNKVSVRPAKTQISLGIRPVWSESSLCAQWVGKDPSFLPVESKDSDQAGQMPRLIWVFAGHTATLLVLSKGGSIIQF